MKAQVNYRSVAKLFILISVLFSVIFWFIRPLIFRFLEQTIIPDHSLTPQGEYELTAIFYFGLLVLLAIGFYFWNVQNTSWREKMRRVLWGEPLCRQAQVRPSPKLVFLMTTFAGLLLIASMRLTARFPSVFELLYKKDHGVLDLYVSVAIFIAALLLAAVVWKLWKMPRLGKFRLPLILIYGLMVLVFVFYVGEEISWGQDFLHWETPEAFAGNVEDQTNLHNYFNQYFDYGYIALSLVLVIVLVSTWLEYHGRLLPYNRLVLPHPSLIGLGFLIAFVAIVWYQEQELLEEMVATFILFYGIRLFACFRSKDLSLEI